MTDNKNSEISYKILLLGDSSVGKTCFLKRYIDNTFQDAYLSTIGFDFKYKFVTLKSGKQVKIQLWDTAGQERFRTIAKSYYKGAHGIVLIYDVTVKKTYDNIRKWLNQIKNEASRRISIILVGNKIDCDDKREVTTEEGQKLADSNQLPFYEASAKESININECFQDLIEKIDENYININLNSEKLNIQKIQKKKSGCC